MDQVLEDRRVGDLHRLVTRDVEADRPDEGLPVGTNRPCPGFEYGFVVVAVVVVATVEAGGLVEVTGASEGAPEGVAVS